MKYDFMVDHFVAVLSARQGSVVIGDPMNGRLVYTDEAFARSWRFCGIVLHRQ